MKPQYLIIYYLVGFALLIVFISQWMFGYALGTVVLWAYAFVLINEHIHKRKKG